MKFNRLIALMLQMAFNFMQPQTPMQPQKPQQQPQPQQQTVQANGGSVPSQENKRKGVKYEATELGANSKRNRAEIAVNLRRTTRDKVVAKRRMNAKGEMVEMMRQPTSLFDEKKRDNNPEWKFPSKIPDRAMLMSAVINVPKLEEYAQLAAKRTDPSWTKEEREARAALITIARVYNNPHMDIKTLTITTKSLRRHMELDHPPIKECVESGFLPKLLAFCMDVKTPELQAESTWVIANITCASSVWIRRVVEIGGTLILMELLRSPHMAVKEQALWALGNIAGDSLRGQNHLLSLGVAKAIPFVYDNMGTEKKVEFVRILAWLIFNVMSHADDDEGDAVQPECKAVTPLLPVMLKILHSTDSKTQRDIGWAWSFFLDDKSEDNHRLDVAIQMRGSNPADNLCMRIAQLSVSPDRSVQMPMIKAGCGLLAGDDRHAAAILNCQFLTCLCQCLMHPDKEIRKEACFGLSNITAAQDPRQVQLFLDCNGLLQKVIDMIKTDKHFVLRDATLILTHAIVSCYTDGTSEIEVKGENPEQVAKLNNQMQIIMKHPDVLEALGHSLAALNADPTTQIEIIEALDYCLQYGARFPNKKLDVVNPIADRLEELGITDTIRGLCGVDDVERNAKLQTMAMELIQKFFGTGDGDLDAFEDARPDQKESKSSFAFGSSNAADTGVFGNRFGLGTPPTNVPTYGMPWDVPAYVGSAHMRRFSAQPCTSAFGSEPKPASVFDTFGGAKHNAFAPAPSPSPSQSINDVKGMSFPRANPAQQPRQPQYPQFQGHPSSSSSPFHTPPPSATPNGMPSARPPSQQTLVTSGYGNFFHSKK